MYKGWASDKNPVSLSALSITSSIICKLILLSLYIRMDKNTIYTKDHMKYFSFSSDGMEYPYNIYS